MIITIMVIVANRVWLSLFKRSFLSITSFEYLECILRKKESFYAMSCVRN